jgi:hypothetical protein
VEENWRCGDLHRGGAAFYRADERRGRAGVPSMSGFEGASMTCLDSTSYPRIEEVRGRRLMGKWRWGDAVTFSHQWSWPEVAMGAAQGRPVAAACFLSFDAGGGRRRPGGPGGPKSRVGRLAAGPIGPKSRRNLFELKIGSLNLQRF